MLIHKMTDPAACFCGERHAAKLDILLLATLALDDFA